MTRKCPYCGFENPDTSSFCGKCAQNTLERYNTKDAKLQRIQRQHQDNFNQKSLLGCGCILAIISLVVVLAIFTFVTNQKPNLQIDNGVKDKTVKPLEPAKFLKKIPINAYVYSTGITFGDNKEVKYNIFTDKEQLTHIYFPSNKENRLSDRSKFDLIEFSYFSGVTSDNEYYVLNAKSCEIGGVKYKYDSEFEYMLESFNIESVAVSQKYIICFFKNDYILAAKINRKWQLIDTMRLSSLEKFNAVNSMYYDDDENALYITDGATIYRHVIEDLHKIEEEIKYAPVDEINNKILFMKETVWSITKYRNKLIVLTTKKEKSTKYVYEIDARWLNRPSAVPFVFNTDALIK